MKVTVIPIVIGAPGTISKDLVKELEGLEIGGKADTIQATAFSRLVRILRRALEI